MAKVMKISIVTRGSEQPIASARLNVVALNAKAVTADTFDYRRWWSSVDFEVNAFDLPQVVSAIEAFASELRAKLEKEKS